MGDTQESTRRSFAPRASLDADGVRAAYKRWAGVYDLVFGGVSAVGRRRAVELANRMPGSRVLEVGVGTGLALPHYLPMKRITGIDLSAEMLAQARKRVSEAGLKNVEALREMDAEATDFADASFDIAVAMFVASVVPHPRALLAEMQRARSAGTRILPSTNSSRPRILCAAFPPRSSRSASSPWCGSRTDARPAVRPAASFRGRGCDARHLDLAHVVR